MNAHAWEIKNHVKLILVKKILFIGQIYLGIVISLLLIKSMKNKQIDVDPLPPIVINIFFSIKYFFENTFLCEKYIFLGKGKGRGKEFWSLDTPNFDFLFKIPLVFRNIMWWKRSNWIPSQSRVFWKILRPFHGFCDYPITMGPVPPPHSHTTYKIYWNNDTLMTKRTKLLFKSS